MILMDYSAIAIANIVRTIRVENEILTNEFCLHMILNSIRKNNKEFSNDFGPMIICCDSSSNWRKDFFKFYKYKRRKEKENSDFNWELVYEALNFVKKEIERGFPYLVIEEYNAEADDIIGVLAKYSTENKEPSIIISNDKDFIQCHSEYVCQYKPMDGTHLCMSEPQVLLKELIIRGDGSDGVPNIKSPDNIFTLNGKRQKSIYKKELDIWLKDDNNIFLEELDHKFLISKKKEDHEIIPSINYKRNDMLINLNNTPNDLRENIIEKYESGEQKANKPMMVKFFMKHKLRYLQTKINDFM